MNEQPRRIQACVRKVLNELPPEALLRLKDPRLEVKVLAENDFISAWAYFPVHRRRCIARMCSTRPETRVLLVFSTPVAQKESRKVFEDHIRDHLGHVLLYLRNPKARNECADAMKK